MTVQSSCTQNNMWIRHQDRQLRAWHRHVRTTVAMELATARHHSAQGPKKRVVEKPREEELLVKRSAYLFGACYAGGAQGNLEFSGR